MCKRFQHIIILSIYCLQLFQPRVVQTWPSAALVMEALIHTKTKIRKENKFLHALSITNNLANATRKTNLGIVSVNHVSLLSLTGWGEWELCVLKNILKISMITKLWGNIQLNLVFTDLRLGARRLWIKRKAIQPNSIWWNLCQRFERIREGYWK